MEVAIPWIISPPVPICSASSSSFPRIPSRTIFPPMNSSRPKAIHGIYACRDLKRSRIVRTQIQPTIGISSWNPPNTPAIFAIRLFGMSGSRSPFTRETEKASIASPKPSSTLSRTSVQAECISNIPPRQCIALL